MPPSLLEQAKGGDAAAIAALMNQALQPKGVTVRGDRQGDCLQLWLTASTLPPQAATVDYVRRGVARLQVASLGRLQIYGEQTDRQQPPWGVELAMGSATAKITQLTLESPPIPESPSAPEAEPVVDTITHAYALLGLEPGASLQQVEGTYFKLKALALREGDRPRVEDLKQAFWQLKDHIENPPVEKPAVSATPEPAPSVFDDESLTPLERVETILKGHGVSAQASTQDKQLYISWLAVRIINPEEAARQVQALLTQPTLAKMGLQDLETLVISGLSRDRAVVWQQTLHLLK